MMTNLEDADLGTGSGIQFITDPAKRNSHSGSAGRYNLPSGFDRAKWAASWVPQNDVTAKQQREPLIGIAATADGWTVYKGVDGRTQKQFTVIDKGVTYVLMVRPRVVQDAVNTLYGNFGKQRTMFEQQGLTAAGAPLQDRGMVTEARLRGLGLAEEPVQVSEQLAATPITGLTGQQITARRTT